MLSSATEQTIKRDTITADQKGMVLLSSVGKRSMNLALTLKSKEFEST